MKGKEIVEAFEQSDVILKFSLPELKLPLWPFVRFTFLDMYSAKVNNLTSTSTGYKKSFKMFFEAFLASSLKNPFFISSKDVLFFNSGVTNVKLNDGKYFNRVTDYFYFEIPTKAALIEDLHNFKVLTPRAHKDVYYSLPLKLASKKLSLIKPTPLKSETWNEIKNLLSYLSSIAPVSVDDTFWHNCVAIFEKQVVNAKKQFSFYRGFLKKKSPNIIFLEDASYGSNLPLLLAAKNLKIPVAELQHGLINENHLAYVFGEEVVKNFHYFLPDYFLSYSKYWTNLINLPSTKIEIGNPYLEHCFQIYPKKANEKVLILGTGTSKEQLIYFCKELKKNPCLQSYKFSLRPHPWERSVARTKYLDLIEIGYEIDFTDNLYDCLSSSAFVFGEMSTAIFEASVYKIPTYLIATDHCLTNITEDTPFPLIELTSDVSGKNFLSTNQSRNYVLWAEDWKSNFHEFIKRFIE